MEIIRGCKKFDDDIYFSRFDMSHECDEQTDLPQHIRKTAKYRPFTKQKSTIRNANLSYTRSQHADLVRQD